MHTLLTILIGLAIAGWFLYCLYRMLRGARGRTAPAVTSPAASTTKAPHQSSPLP